MANEIGEEDERETLAAMIASKGNIQAAADSMGKARATIQARVKNLKRKGLWPPGANDGAPELPQFPDDDIPVPEIIDSLTRRFEKRHDYHRAKRWFPIKLTTDEPIGIGWFGDPHVDDNGCNWPLLRRDCEIHRKTKGLYGANIGDATNNWIGRLARLYGDQDTSKATARKLARWLLTESGVSWLLWLMGNHDLWNDGDALLKAMNVNRIPMEDWQAQFRLVFPNKRECRVWASHNFAGHSMWNTLHGPQKAAHMKDWAHVYVCGHTHNWGLHQEESASREFTYWLARTRGYKFIDSHAMNLGHQDQQEGASILQVIDPHATTMSNFVLCFADLEHGADYLTWLRKKRA